MFFSTDFLSKKNGGSLGIVWLAATMGTSGQSRRISKKEYQQVDVVEACDFVSQPPQSLALRLSSNLMFGIVRVYGQKCAIYYDDVNSFLTRIRRVAVQEESLLLLAAAETKYEQITMARPSLASRWFQNNAAQLLPLPSRHSRSTLQQFGWMDSTDNNANADDDSQQHQQLSLLHSQQTSLVNSSFEGGVNLQDPRDITLHNINMSSHSLSHNGSHNQKSGSNSSGGSDDFFGSHNPLNIDDLLASGTGDLLFEFEQNNQHGNAELFVTNDVLMQSDTGNALMSKQKKKRQFGDVDEDEFMHMSFEHDNLREMPREHAQADNHAVPHVERQQKQQQRKRNRKSNQFDNIVSLPVRDLLRDPSEMSGKWFMKDLQQQVSFNQSLTQTAMKDFYVKSLNGMSLSDMPSVQAAKQIDVSTAGRPSLAGDYSIEVGRNRGSISSGNDQNIVSSSSNATYDRHSVNSSDQSSLLQGIDVPIHDGRDSNVSFLGNMSFNTPLMDEPWQLPVRDNSRVSLGNESQSQFTFEVNTPLPDMVAQAMDGCVEFKQLLPATGVEKKNMRKVASKMFFNLLVSLTKNQVNVEQDRAYGPIIIMAKA